MKFRRNRQAKKARIEIVPMIDVMFFLLASFMLASLAMLNYQGIDVNLASGKAHKIDINEQLIIKIDEKDRIFIEEKLIKIQDLSVEIAKKLDNPEKLVLIACDKNAKQGTAIAAMLAAQESGAHHFSMLINETK